MEHYRSTSLVCPADQHCSEWARLHLDYCLCGVKDGVSVTLGMMSVISWGVAEIPQIWTNYREKSTEGLSVAFLATWILGDLFNIFGCLLEPATLPTQYYMAVLYTITSAILFAQTVYYVHIYQRLKTNRWLHKIVSADNNEEISAGSGGKVADHSGECQRGPNIGGVPLSSPIPVTLPSLPNNRSRSRESYYKSARYLSRSYNSATESFLAQRATESSAHSWSSVEEPLLGGGLFPAESAPPSKTKPILCVVSTVTFFLSIFDHLSANSRFGVIDKSNQGVVIGSRRTLLEINDHLSPQNGGDGYSGIGNLLGWGMAIIYMGGRLPQICLNIRRGHMKGLNPGMFIFALIGNITYVASILVNSLDWSKIGPNLPWLADAGGCALLDSFILIQFMYFYLWVPRGKEDKLVNPNAA